MTGLIQFARKPVVACLLGCTCLFLAAKESPNSEQLKADACDFRISVEDTSTMVMIAKVHLSIGDLRYDDGNLVGNYAISVPLRPSKSEGGTMRLRLEKPVSHFFDDGGELHGIGKSFKEDKEDRKILCRVFPKSEDGRAGRIELVINTGGRELEFESKYRVSGEPPDGDELALSLPH